MHLRKRAACAWAIAALIPSLAAAQPGRGSSPPAVRWIYEFTATVSTEQLVHTERLKGSKPPTPAAVAPGGRTTSGLEGGVEGVGLRIQGYKPIATYPATVDGAHVNVTVWERNAAEPKHVPDSDFDGSGTARLAVTGQARMTASGVFLEPNTTAPTKFDYMGIAQASPGFKKDFEKRVNAEVAGVLAALRGAVALNAAEQGKLTASRGGEATQTRKFQFFGEEHELRITIKSERKLEGALGVTP